MTTVAAVCWAARRVIGVLLVPVVVASGPAVAAPVMQEHLVDSLRAQACETANLKQLFTSRQRKVDSQIRRSAWPETMPRGRIMGPLTTPPDVPWHQAGRFHVIVRVTGTASADLGALQGAGLEIEIVNDRFNLVQGWIADGAVPAVADLAIVKSISPAWPAEHSTGSVTSEGDHASRADLVRQLGYNGTGVVVGVISDGIDSLATSQASGDLPAVTVPPDPRCRGGSGDEGTAMLEIIHDLAPGAQLLFSGAGTSLEFIDAVNCLVAAGANVTVDDVFFPGEPFFQDGPVALSAATAVAAGSSYHTSAGNYGDGKYLAEDYRPGPSGFHDFDPGAGQDILNRVVVAPGGVLRCVLQWADPFGASSNDYDLLVVDPGTDTILTSSENPQTGSQDPEEAVAFSNPLASPVVVGLAIPLFAGSARALKLLCPDFPLQYSSAQLGISGHAARPEVIAVAAINAVDAGLNDVEPFSTQGPSPIFFPSPVFRPKPDLAAFDGVATTLPAGGPFNPFFGTSAAAPHSAAVAALLLSKNPRLTPAQVQSILTSTAADIEAPGFDDTAGFGRIDALAAINAVPATTTTTLPPCTADGCDDTNPCTDDACDPSAGCQHVANTAACDDGVACTLGDRCSGGQCQAGTNVVAGTVSSLIAARVNVSLDACRSDKRKVVKKIVNPLVQGAKAFSVAELAGVGSKKWRKKVSAGEKSVGTARSKLTRLQPKLSAPCVDALGQAIAAGALGDSCLR